MVVIKVSESVYLNYFVDINNMLISTLYYILVKVELTTIASYVYPYP